MGASKDHYDSLLGAHYTWSRGTFADQVTDSEDVFRAHQILPGKPGESAIDLGCGAGAQTLALAQLGFAVIAVDQCAALLEELNGHRNTNTSVQTVEDDLVQYTHRRDSPVSVIVCMGDTLTHLDSASDVLQLFSNCYDLLTAGGRLVLTYRDLSNPLEGKSRFITVRSSAERIFTCFLEYRSETVLVHDLVHEKTGDTWGLSVSAYPKLRLAKEWVLASLEALGMRVDHCEVARGMVTLVTTKV